MNTHNEVHSVKISVVIPSLCGPELFETIENLNSNSLRPDEIIVCVPEKHIHKLNRQMDENIVIVPTKKFGQVYQRSVGFKQAKNDVVVQVDDDMSLEKTCLEKLYVSLCKLGPEVSVSPALFDLKTGESVYKKRFKNKIVQTIYYRLTNGMQGYRMGVIDKTGSPIGVDPSVLDSKLFLVEWLPGGCVMHYKKNLVLEDYFPLEGKAYCEDLIHSYYLRKQNVKLYVNSTAKCFMHTESYKCLGLLEFMRNVVSDYTARRYYLNLTNKFSVKIFLFYLFMVVNFLTGYLRR